MDRTSPVCLILCTFSTVFLIVALFLALILTPEPVKDLPGPEPCNTSQCRLALRYLDEVGDSSVNPCDDFYGYVCRHWTKIRSSKSGNFLGSMVQTFHEQVDKVLRTKTESWAKENGAHIFVSTYR